MGNTYQRRADMCEHRGLGVIQNDRFITKHSVGFGINRVITSPIVRKAVIQNDKGRSNRKIQGD